MNPKGAPPRCLAETMEEEAGQIGAMSSQEHQETAQRARPAIAHQGQAAGTQGKADQEPADSIPCCPR